MLMYNISAEVACEQTLECLAVTSLVTLLRIFFLNGFQNGIKSSFGGYVTKTITKNTHERRDEHVESNVQYGSEGCNEQKHFHHK